MPEEMPATTPTEPMEKHSTPPPVPPEAEPAAAATPPQEEPRLRYWHEVLTGNPDTVPQEVRERAGANAAGLSPEQQDYALFSAINRSWVVDHRGKNRSEVLAEWKKHRSALAQELGVADDEREVFMALSAREGEAAQREKARRVYESAFYAGLHGELAPRARKICPGLSAPELAAADVVAANAYEEGRNLRERWLPTAQHLADGMDVFAAVEEDVFSAPRVFAGTPGLVQAVDTLAELQGQERDTVAYLAQYLARQQRRKNGQPSEAAQESPASRAVRAVRRGASSLGFGALQALNHAAIATLDNLGGSLGGEFGGSLQQSAAGWDKRMQVLNEIRNLTQQNLRPLLPAGAGRAETFFLEGMQAVPSAVLSCCGGAGFGALALSGMGESVAAARERAPQGSQQLQLAAGVVGGAVQGAIYMGMSRVGGRLLEQSISRFMRARGSGVASYSLAGLKTMLGTSAEGVKLMLAGKAAAAADLGVHELAARADRTASNIDWQQFGENLTDIECNMREAAATLPFLLIGAGRATLHHFRSADNVLGSGQRLLEWGVPQDKVDSILRERNSLQQNELLKTALRESRLWNDRFYSFDIMRAMSLLQTEGVPLFRNREVVREFLQLPVSFTEGLEVAAKPLPPGVKADKAAGYALLNEWERLAGGFRRSAGDITELSINNGRAKRGLMNGRGNYGHTYYFRNEHPLLRYRHAKALPARNASYAPEAGTERLDEVKRRFDELRQLSFNVLLQLYGEDVVTSRRGKDLEQLKAEAEQTRLQFLELASAAICGRAEGKTEQEVFEAFDSACGQMLARYSGRGEGATALHTVPWLSNAPEELLSDINTYCLMPDHRSVAPYPQIRDFYWLMYRARACSAILSDMLPMTDDFRALLAQSKSPAEAYAHLLRRELQLPAAPPEVAISPAPPVPDRAERAAMYMQLTGFRPEQTSGEDGRTLYRIRRPDGSNTPWHGSLEAAFGDLAGNAALTFMPLGTPAEEWLRREFYNPDCLSTLPRAGDYDYSGHDQLCNIALRELGRMWLEDASCRQPGLIRNMHARAPKALEEEYRFHTVTEKLAGENYRLEKYSSMTPLRLALGRFVVYWTRQLDSGMLPAEKAADFLVKAGLLTPKISQELLEMPQAAHFPQMPKPPEGRRGMIRRLGDAMGRFTLRYFLSRVMELPVPQSFKDWYALFAFSPGYEFRSEVPEGEGKKQVRRSFKMDKIQRWLNHQTFGELQRLAPLVERCRTQFADGIPDATIAKLMKAAFSADHHLRAEQSWVHNEGGDHIFRNTSAAYWNMLRYPLETWAVMPAGEREKLSAHLLPPGGASLREAPGTVEAALANLDEVLHMHPSLHLYSLQKGDAERVRILRRGSHRRVGYLGDNIPGDFESQLHTRRDYSVELIDTPTFIRDSEKVRRALATLDALRTYPERLSSYDGENIRWRGKLYGGSHNKPQGLELWTPRPAIVHLRELLWHMADDLAGGDASPALADAGYLQALPVEDVFLPLFEHITAYESEWAPYHVYRLMPGESSSTGEFVVPPYVVGSRKGVYVGQDNAATDTPALVPLHEFRREASHLQRSSEVADFEAGYKLAERAMAGVFRLAEQGSPGEAWVPVEHSPVELLMQLYEDTGFSRRMHGMMPEELSHGGMRAVGLACDLISCISAAENESSVQMQEAYRDLRRTVDFLRENPDEMRELLVSLAAEGPDKERVLAHYNEHLEAARLAEVRRAQLAAQAEENAAPAAPQEEVLPGSPILSREWVDKLVDELQVISTRREALEADPEYQKHRQEMKAREAERINRDWLKRRFKAVKKKHDTRKD